MTGKSKSARATVAAVAIGLAFASLSAAQATAQTMTSGLIKILVPAAPGGATDVVARIVGAKLNQSLGMPVIIEDRPGGILSPAVKETRSATPDGHTLFLITSSILTTQLSRPDVGVDLATDFTPITEVATGPIILVARKDLPIKTIQDLVAYNKQNPMKPIFGLSGGKGSAFDVATELLKQQTGITVTSVPYTSSGPALNDILGGHIDMFFDVLPAEVSQVKSGAVTGVMVTSAARVPSLPNIPTTAEVGLKDFVVDSWFGLLAPPNTPPSIVKQLRDTIATDLTQQDVIDQLSSQGVVAVASEPGDWGTYLSAEKARWSKVLDASKAAK